MVKVITNSQGKVYVANGKALLSDSGTKYGVSINNILGDKNSSNELSMPQTSVNLIISGIENILQFGLYYKFYGNRSITGVSFPDLKMVTGNSSLSHAFYDTYMSNINFPVLQQINSQGAFENTFGYCALTTVSFPELIYIYQSNACRGIFYACEQLTSAYFPKLEVISGDSAFRETFLGNIRLTTISFPKLHTIEGNEAFRSAFESNASLTDIYFDSLTTTSFGSNSNQFKYMMRNTGTNVTHTLHFPSNLSSTISGLSGYPLFGGTSGYVTLAFDLPATS